jgi:hypothetical protein
MNAACVLHDAVDPYNDCGAIGFAEELEQTFYRRDPVALLPGPVPGSHHRSLPARELAERLLNAFRERGYIDETDDGRVVGNKRFRAWVKRTFQPWQVSVLVPVPEEVFAHCHARGLLPAEALNA